MSGAWFWWFLLGLGLIGAETFIPGLAIIFFGLGALATGLVSLVPPFSWSPALQAVFWSVSSVLALVFLRARFKELLRGTAFFRAQDDGPVDAIAGEEATVTERVTPDAPGRVHFHGTSWKAIAYDETFEAGQKVRVAVREGLALVVTKDYLAREEDRSLPGSAPALPPDRSAPALPEPSDSPAREPTR